LYTDVVYGLALAIRFSSSLVCVYQAASALPLSSQFQAQ